ncbi:MAG: phosphatidylglycerol lysyltransferase domain-containing protein, partial [Candidatus Nanopelagicales bacterium]
MGTAPPESANPAPERRAGSASRASDGLRTIVGLIGATTGLGPSLLSLAKHPRTLGAADEARVRTLLLEFGEADSLGYIATRRDRGVVWDSAHPAAAQAGVSHQVFDAVSLAVGSPVGDPVRWPAAIEAWLTDASDHGWSLAVIGAGEEGVAAYAEAGLEIVELGDEAVLDVREFSLNGPGMKPVRRAAHRLQKAGYQVEATRHGDLPPQLLNRLATTVGQWRADQDERGFAMALGRLGDPLDADCVLVAARDAGGALRGFLSLVPWGRNGLALDLMRLDPAAGDGLLDLMVSSLAERAPTLAVARVSLNFAILREAFDRGEPAGGGPIARLRRQALLQASRNWQPESLYRSNARYLPEWRPRFACFERAADLTLMGVVAGNGEGLGTEPAIALMLRRGAELGAGATGRGGPTAGAPEAARTPEAARAPEAAPEIPAPPGALEEALSTEGLPEQVRVRLEKLNRLRERGIEPYSVGYPRTHTLAEVREQAGELPPDTHTGVRVGVAGRVILKRDGGKLCFATLRDGSGDLQVMVSLASVGADVLEHWRRDIDLGDHVGVTGEVITSKRGELSLFAESLALTSKALRPLPEKFKGLTDPEARVRARYVDLIIRPGARDIAHLRSTVVASVRDSLQRRGFVEVETPTLQLIHGGANARPFETHINAYDLDLYL